MPQVPGTRLVCASIWGVYDTSATNRWSLRTTQHAAESQTRLWVGPVQNLEQASSVLLKELAPIRFSRHSPFDFPRDVTGPYNFIPLTSLRRLGLCAPWYLGRFLNLPRENKKR